MIYITEKLNTFKEILIKGKKMNDIMVKMFLGLLLLYLPFGANDPCDSPTPINGDLENCDQWITYRIASRDGFWFIYRTVHFPDFAAPEREHTFGGPVGDVHQVPSRMVISIETRVNGCDGIDWAVNWDRANVVLPPNRPNFSLYIERCLLGSCEGEEGGNPLF